MKKLRIVVADDSPTARALILAILEADRGFDIVGVAKDGVEAVEMAKRLLPDVISMDVQMPRMTGLEATAEIMIHAPTPIVIVSASFLAGEVAGAMQALRAGALTVVAKPSGPGSPEFEATARELVESLKALAEVKVVRHYPKPAMIAPRPVGRTISSRLVTICASTGGPAALCTILGALPADFPVPIVIVQHIALGFGAGFASWLASTCAFDVRIASHGDLLQAGRVYIAPDDRHLEVGTSQSLSLRDTAPIGGFRPSGSQLFTSAAQVFGAATLGIILTGMGRDGVEGLRELRRLGAPVIAQNEATSVVYGMPAAAVEAGVVTQVLPIDAIASAILASARPLG